ncbi:MAG: hypothetical protein JWR80_6814 [Bradyrhizobium sp.]|nr:hypothetical protein [Bradyrhizobium sp.]
MCGSQRGIEVGRGRSNPPDCLPRPPWRDWFIALDPLENLPVRLEIPPNRSYTTIQYMCECFLRPDSQDVRPFSESVTHRATADGECTRWQFNIPR